MAAAFFILSAAPLCLCLLVSAAGQRNITAEPGEDVRLPCKAEDGRNIDVVEWNRPDLEPKYVLLYRLKQSDPSYQHPSFHQRVDLQDRQMKDGDVSLILKNVTTNDTGTYECRVFQGRRNRRKRANLDSDPISIIHLEVSPSGQKIITAEPGDDVTLPCRAGDDGNIVVLKWTRPDLGSEYVLLYRDGRSDPNHQHPSFQQRADLQDRQMKDGDASLILKKVTTDDTGIYECRVFWRGTNRRKRANLDSDPISTIHLEVSPSGPGPVPDPDPTWVIVAIVVLPVVMVGGGVGAWIKRKEVQNLLRSKTSSQRVSSASDDQKDLERGPFPNAVL